MARYVLSLELSTGSPPIEPCQTYGRFLPQLAKEHWTDHDLVFASEAGTPLDPAGGSALRGDDRSLTPSASGKGTTPTPSVAT